MRLAITLLTAVALAGCGGSPEAGPSNGALGANDITPLPADSNGFASENALGDVVAPAPRDAADYVALAGGGDRFEIESAALALEKSQREEVRELATMIRTDHQRSTEQLREAAATAGQAAPEAPPLNPQQQTMLQALRDAQPEAFDALYLQQQIQAHQQTLNLARGYAANGDSAPLRAHAQGIIRPVEEHLQRARQLATR